MDSIRILLVDDHEVVRAGLKSYLETQPGLEVVGEAGDGFYAIELAQRIQPDIVVMDISMPGMDGMEATRRLRNRLPLVKVLALTVHEGKEYFFEMLACGAAGYLTKQSAAEELVDAIRRVAAGEVYLQPALARWLLEDYQRLANEVRGTAANSLSPDPEAVSLDMLTPRELQVLERIAGGLSAPEIGQDLGISHKTVARHRERMMKKLNIHSCVELTRFAIKTGLVRLN